MTVAEIVRRYEAGESGPQIARAAHMSVGTVYDRLDAAGVERRRGQGHPRLSADEIERTIELYHEHGAVEAARLLGVHEFTVRWRLRHNGVPRSNTMAHALPEPPGGYRTLAQEAERRGCSVRAMRHRLDRGLLSGAVREQRWPHRWLVPVEEVAA